MGRSLRLTDAAQPTNRSQSTVTRQVQLLEGDLGVELPVPRRNKLLGLTPHGEEILALARRMIRDAESMHNIGRNAIDDERGTFTIATTNFQAKYALPEAIGRFIERYPRVRLSLRQGTPTECRDLVALGHTDVAICAEVDMPAGLTSLPCDRLHRVVMTPPRHPLLRIKPLTLEALARFPLIAYDDAFSGSLIVNRTFAAKGLTPNIVLSVVDADVAKIYLGMGIGIAIAASVAFYPKQDLDLRRVDERHLFGPSDVAIVLQRNSHLRTYMIDFIEMFAPRLTRPIVEDTLFGRASSSILPASLPEL